MSGTDFAEVLKSIRKQRGLSQEAIAELLGTSKQVISRYERGERVPKLSVAVKYAEILGVTLEELNGQVQHVRDYTSAGIAARGKLAEWRAMMEDIEHSRALGALDALYDEDERQVIEAYHQMTKAQKRRFKRLLEIINTKLDIR